MAAANAVPPSVVRAGAQAIAAGGYHSMVLKGDGTVWAAGWNDFGQLGDGTERKKSRFVDGTETIESRFVEVFEGW